MHYNISSENSRLRTEKYNNQTNRVWIHSIVNLPFAKRYHNFMKHIKLISYKDKLIIQNKTMYNIEFGA